LPKFAWVCACGHKIHAKVETDDVVRCPYCDKSCDYETVSRLAAEFKAKQSTSNAAIFFGFITVVIGALFVFVFPIAGVALIVGGAAGAAVYDDAYKRRDDAPGAWALGTWLLLIIVLPLYLYHRAYGSRTQTQMEAKTPTPSQTTVGDASILTMFCRECGANIPRDSKFCKECGTKVVT
jgi:hypothetical protein